MSSSLSPDKPAPKFIQIPLPVKNPNPQGQAPADASPVGSLSKAESFNGKSLAMLQHERRKVENDAVVLANRLALLRHEEAKTLKKIEETRRKALEVFNRKREIEDRHREKQAAEEQHKVHVSINQRGTNKARHEAQEKIRDLRNLVAEEKRREWLEVKKQEDMFSKQIKEVQAHQTEERRQKVAMVKEMKNKATKKLEAYALEREELARANYEEKKRREAERKEQLIKDINEMERRETELLSMLQARQSIHRDAYGQLEDALAMPTEEFASRHHFALPKVNSSTRLVGNAARIQNITNPKRSREDSGMTKAGSSSRILNKTVEAPRVNETTRFIDTNV